MKQITIDIVESKDHSVQCIHALRQVMDFFMGSGLDGMSNGLSPMGNDRAAVLAWFAARYPVDGVVRFDDPGRL